MDTIALVKWKMRQLIVLIITMLLLPITFAAMDIDISTDNATWINITDTQYGGVIDETNESAYVQNLDPSTTYYFRARNSTTNWQYAYQATDDGGETSMTELAITIFVLSIVFGLFILPFKVKRFAKHEVLNDLLRKSCWVLGLLFLSLSTAMVATLASAADIDLLNELYTFMRIINWGVYIAMLILVLSFFLNTIKLWQDEAKKIRLE